MNARASLIVSRVCWIAMAIIAIGLIFGPALCFAQVLGRPASESYVTSKINAHAYTNNAHADIRAQVFAATTNVNALTIAVTNATEAAHAATVQANAAILKNTQQDVDISYLYASNANTMAIANLANTRAQAANVTNAQNGAAIVSVSNLTVTAQATANAAVIGVTAVSNLFIGVKALNENAITNETDSLALKALSDLSTNRVTRVYNPTNFNEWTDGNNKKWNVVTTITGSVYRVSESVEGSQYTVGLELVKTTEGGSGDTYYITYERQQAYIGFNDDGTTGWWIYNIAGADSPVIYGNSEDPNAPYIYASNFVGGVSGYIRLNRYDLGVTVTSHVDTVAMKSDISALTIPTNVISGWMLFDPGSNVWLTVTVSNFSFKVWEVSQ